MLSGAGMPSAGVGCGAAGEGISDGGNSKVGEDLGGVDAGVDGLIMLRFGAECSDDGNRSVASGIDRDAVRGSGVDGIATGVGSSSGSTIIGICT